MLWNDWASVLELSYMWQMAKVQEMAVKKILEYRVSTDNQRVLLRLSTKLGITEIRNRAIRTLSGTLLPVEQVEFGIECQVDSWLLKGYKQLVEQVGGISVEDERRLGWKRTSKLLRIRDQYLQTNSNPFGGHYNSTNLIMEAFAEELKDAVWVAD